MNVKKSDGGLETYYDCVLLVSFYVSRRVYDVCGNTITLDKVVLPNWRWLVVWIVRLEAPGLSATRSLTSGLSAAHHATCALSDDVILRNNMLMQELFFFHFFLFLWQSQENHCD